MHASESRPPTSFSAFLYHPQAEKEAAKEAERAAKEAEKAAVAAAKEAAKEAERAAREEEKAAKAAEKERLKVRGCCGCFSLCRLVGLVCWQGMAGLERMQVRSCWLLVMQCTCLGDWG